MSNKFTLGGQSVPGQDEVEPQVEQLDTYAVVRINICGRGDYNFYIDDGGPADPGVLGARTIVDSAPTRDQAAAKALALSKAALARTSEFAYGVMRRDGWEAGLE